MLIGDMDSINILEKRKDVPLAIKTVVNSIFAPVLLMLSLLLCCLSYYFISCFLLQEYTPVYFRTQPFFSILFYILFYIS